MRFWRAGFFFAATVAAHPALAEPGVTADKIRIGQSVGLTGPVAAVGAEIRDGLNAAFHTINRKGGIGGRTIELVSADDGFVPTRTGENTRAMKDDVFAFAGYLGTPHTAEGIKAASPARIPVVCPIIGAQSLRSVLDHNVFYMRAGYRDEVDKMVTLLLTIGAKQIGLFYQNDPFGKEGLAALEATLARSGLKIAASTAIERGSVDVEPAVRALSGANLQAIIIFTVTKPAALFIKRMRQLGSSAQMMTLSTNANDDFVKELGDAAQGVGHAQVVPHPWNTVSSLAKEYQQAMHDIGRDNLSYLTYEAYICGKVIGEGLRRTGTNVTRERFIVALESMNPYEVGSGFEFRFSPRDHIGSHYVDLTVLSANGRYLR